MIPKFIIQLYNKIFNNNKNSYVKRIRNAFRKHPIRYSVVLLICVVLFIPIKVSGSMDSEIFHKETKPFFSSENQEQLKAVENGKPVDFHNNKGKGNNKNSLQFLANKKFISPALNHILFANFKIRLINTVFLIGKNCNLLTKSGVQSKFRPIYSYPNDKTTKSHYPSDKILVHLTPDAMTLHNSHMYIVLRVYWAKSIRNNNARYILYPTEMGEKDYDDTNIFTTTNNNKIRPIVIRTLSKGNS